MGGPGSTRWEGYERRATVAEAPARLTLRQLLPALRRADFTGTRRGTVAGARWLRWSLAPVASDGSRALQIERVREASPSSSLWPGEEDASAGDVIASVMAEVLAIGPRATVRCVATRGRLGGQQWWLTCPECARRCRALYVVADASARSVSRGPGVRCRRCARLTYPTQLADRLERAAARVDALERRVGLNSFWPSPISPAEPQRPRGMHRRTFQRLLEELAEARSAYDACWLEQWTADVESLHRAADPIRKRLAARLAAEDDPTTTRTRR